jgi:DNA-binding SARP family transcriptional activator
MGLQIYLLGTMQITESDGRPLPLTPTVQSLFAYLVLNRHQSHRRDVLIDVFWNGHPESKAKRCLSTALWRLHRELDNELLDTSLQGEIRFDAGEHVWIDIANFESKAAMGLAKPLAAMELADVALLEAATALYRGELLVGYYDDWVLQERERLNLLYLRCLARLMAYFRLTQNWQQGIVYGRKILQVDPLREQIHRELMLLYLESGQHPLAIQQYHQCRRILAEEMGIEPMTETTTMYHNIILRNQDAALRLTAAHRPIEMTITAAKNAATKNAATKNAATQNGATQNGAAQNGDFSQVALSAQAVEQVLQQIRQAVRELEGLHDSLLLLQQQTQIR